MAIYDGFVADLDGWWSKYIVIYKMTATNFSAKPLHLHIIIICKQSGFAEKYVAVIFLYKTADWLNTLCSRFYLHILFILRNICHVTDQGSQALRVVVYVCHILYTMYCIFFMESKWLSTCSPCTVLINKKNKYMFTYMYHCKI